MLEGEGMLVMRDYDAGFKELVADCAREAGVHAAPRACAFATPPTVCWRCKRGYRAVMIGSINRFKAPVQLPLADATRQRTSTTPR